MTSFVIPFINICCIQTIWRNMDDIIKIRKTYQEFNKVYEIKRKNLPYIVNLIDELRANENAHSRILLKLLKYRDNNKYPILELLFNFLGDGFDKLEIINPVFTAEKERIDMLIKDKGGNYAVIIENKIHGAVDQSNQLERYIDKVKNSGYNDEQIYVIYLSNKGSTPSTESISEAKRESLEDRYREINYKTHIVKWLEHHVLPSCRYKDTLLISAIQQYIDHLRGMFHLRKIEKNMNKELMELLKKEIGITKFSNSNEKLEKFEDEKRKIKLITEYLEEIQKETVVEFFNQWFDNMKSQCSPDVVSNVITLKPDTEYLYVGVRLQYQGIEFACGIGADNYISNPYFGLNIRGCSETKNQIIQDFVTNNFPEYNLKPSKRWYGLNKESDFTNVYTKFMELYNAVIYKIN